jgi:ABC-type transport system involved in cytochrome bd biosynthesis fused ATPase/permease subunit
MRNSLNTNLLILDEVFDGSLDGDSSHALQKVLSQASQDANIFVISHRENLQDNFVNIVKFVKRKNFSTIDT